MPIPFKTSSPMPSTEKKHLCKNPSSAETKHLVFNQDAIAVRYTKDYLFILIFSPFFFMAVLYCKLDVLSLLFLAGVLELICFPCFIFCLFNTRNLPFFDILNGKFYPKGRHHADTAVSTKDIDHLQFIEIEMSKKSCYYGNSCYELNAVIKNGNRFNIIARGGRQDFLKDAKQLAASLAIPLKDENGEPYIELPGKFKGPLVPGGSSFQSMHLIFRQDSITVRATWKLQLGYMVFMVIGTGIFCFGLFRREGIICVLGALLAMIGLLNFLGQMLKRTFPLFDMVEGMFYPKGFTRDGPAISLRQLDHLEILREHVVKGGGRHRTVYDAYELNAVLKDGSRYNVMDHGNKKRMWEDAHELADRLSLPLVDAQSGLSVMETLSAKS